MQLKNDRRRWGVVSKTFHWIIVLLIIVQYAIAQRAEGLPLGLQKLQTLAWHKSFGITILALAVLRVLWRWMNPTPDLPNTLKPYERVLAKMTHFGLYALIFLIPLSGWAMSSAANFPVSWFGLATLPDFVTPSKELQHTFHDVHEALFGWLVGIAALHVVAALKHHFWLKDTVLKRMLPFGRVD